VEKRPTYVTAGMDDATGKPALVQSEFSFVTVRTDTERELGQVSAQYVPMQNADAFRVIEPLVDQGVARLETGGVIRNGADAWLLIQWDLERFGPIVREVFAGEIAPFGLLANNHDRRRGILLQDTNIRVVCANTLGFAEGATERRIVVKHSGKARGELVAAAEEMWGGIIERYEKLALQYRALKARVLQDEEFTAMVLDVIAPLPQEQPDFNPEAKMAEAVIARAERKRNRLSYLYEHGKGHVGDRSAWEAYNGAVEALDHDRELWPTHAGVWRTASLMSGTLKRLKDDCLAGLVTASTRN
jgi:phage/plasmid-like protein (TIGR03299 family)